MPNPLSDFRTSPDSHRRGRRAEDAAVAWLESQGYAVLARNHETAAGEIDLVAHDGDTVCFVEIKARLDLRYGAAVAQVSRRKQGRLARAASLYLAETGWTGPCRFDVLGLEPGEKDWEYHLIRDAFEVPWAW